MGTVLDATCCAVPEWQRRRWPCATGPLSPALAVDRRRVAVLGGGMAGLAAAHELIERGFEVTVYERKSLGGKARSIPVAGTASGGRRPLPGEHGFRFFPGFYHHIPDTMARIPYGTNENGVFDNLVGAGFPLFPRSGGRNDHEPVRPDPRSSAPGASERRSKRFIVKELVGGSMIKPVDATYFATRLVVFLCSCDERRFGSVGEPPRGGTSSGRRSATRSTRRSLPAA